MATLTGQQFVSAQNRLVVQAIQDLRRVWRRIEGWDALRKRQELEGHWRVLTSIYGEAAAALAADRFEELTGLPARMADPLPEEQVDARLRWAVTPLFGGAGDEAALANLASAAGDLIKRPGRRTMIESAARHNLRYARVPVGDTCAFCLMLGSRGAIYHSDKSAGMMDDWHPKCNCQIEPVATDRDLDRLSKEYGYDPEALYDRYRTAADAAGYGPGGKPLSLTNPADGPTSDLRAVMKELRAQQGIH